MPARRKPKTALRGAVNNIIMESLYDGEKYGYEIIKEVEEKTNGKIKLKQPSLYSSLKRFEAKGYIESHWQDSDIGGKRHYYKLTESGIKYYRKNILKEDIEEEIDKVLENDVNEEYIEDQLESYEIDEDDGNNDLSKYEYNVDDKLNSLLGIEAKQEETREDILDELYDEIDEDNEPIYTEDDLNNDIQQKEVVADHEFRTPTPMIEIIENDEDNTNAFDDIMMKEDDNNDIFDDIDMDKTYEAKKYSDDNEEVKEFPKQEKKEEKAKIFTDEYGITRMYYGEEEPKRNDKVFDNVVIRTASQDIYSKTSQKNNYKEEKQLTDEEKELKSKLFFEKFDNKSEQIKREKELSRANEPKKEPEEKIDYNYKSKLNNLFYSSQDDEEDFVSEEVNYEYEQQEDEDYTFESNYDNDDVVEENTDYTMKVYTEEKKKDPTIKYLHINKAKFAFGLTMLIFMLFQVTIMLIVFKNKGLLMDNQFWVFQLSYIIVAVITLIYCIPVFISPNKQASNSFKLGYSLMFGALTFFIVVILTYAINTFMGMELFNIHYYLATLIVPIALSLNFIMGPIIYWIITQNKKFY